MRGRIVPAAGRLSTLAPEHRRAGQCFRWSCGAFPAMAGELACSHGRRTIFMTIAPDKLRAARLPSLNGLRWVAAILVFTPPITAQGPFVGGPCGGFLDAVFARSGYCAVSFFFVLSGFVLTWSARPNDKAAGFWRRRLGRIYPHHPVTLVLAGVLMVVTATPLTTKSLLSHLFLVQTWVPDAVVWKSLNVSSWSLAC